MALTPELNAGDFVGSAEVIAVAVFAEPPLLADGFADFPAGRFAAVVLAIFGSRVRKKEPVAVTAFTTGERKAHCRLQLADVCQRKKTKKKNPKKTKSEEGRRL